MSDDILVTKYQQSGDMEVLATLFLRYSDMLYAACLKYLKQPELSKDAVLDIFEQLGPKVKKHSILNFKSWLYTLAKNHCLMQLRSDKKHKVLELKSEFMQSQEELHLNGILEKEDTLRKLEDCISQLPADQKNAVDLFYLQNKCYKEISEITGLEWNSIRSFIQNGRRNLKLCMEKKEKQPTAGSIRIK